MSEDKKNINKSGKEVQSWYVLKVIGGKERKVKEYIENEINRLKLSDFITSVIMPTQKVYHVRKGKKINKERNFFPGYVLVEAQLTGEIPHILQNIPNVISFLGEKKGGDPLPLRESEVNRILRLENKEDDFGEVIETPYVPGDMVEITDGPFSTFSGTVEEVLEDKRKLKVIVKIFERKTLVELRFSQVEKAKEKK